MTPGEPSGPSSSAVLRQLADLSEIRGDRVESARLRRAAGEIDSDTRQASSNLGSEPWRSDRETASELRRSRARIPWLLRRLVELAALPLSEAVALARAGIVTFPDLAHAVRAKPTQFGTVTLAQLRQAEDALSSELKLLTLGRATDVLDLFLTRLREVGPSIEEIAAAGGVRRYEPLVDALVIVGRAVDPEAVIATIATLPDIDDVLHRAARRLIVTYNRIEVDVRIVTPDEYGSVLLTATGPPEHVAAIAARTSLTPIAREQDVYAAAGLSFIAPELRQGTDEIESAADRKLPSLVDVEHIRGDLHMHSTYSDGQDPIELMVSAAAALGYEYIAITDHSERAAAARTLTLDTLARQRDEVALLREKYPAIAILHGIEVDIMPDGRLDFPDDVLGSLDIVLASLHDAAGQSARALTRRCLAAIRHPLVSIITHPSNRIVGRRPGYPLDFPAIYEAAVEAGTALEIDGAPSHLDMDGAQARAAVAAGVTVAIDSDCHRAAALGRQMRFGVGTARRGWVEPRHVLNTRSLAEVRRFIAAKRA